ncbi:PREDICTED: uncharacterized protein LOC105570540 [Vollenhovia emeryi]|uniref:uncharacterized protein LOC105570540 n=1 Tax=Vollenhovia emeryi TaxID=411798 RepID=UPI0005F53FDC|nr:PREDICTED: uncharacterized protein LOC105570540 [Vollenhovia emeryi]
MEWNVVHFVDDNVVEAIPSNWVFGDICYWPSYKGTKLTQAISSNCMSPIIGEWEVCKIWQLANGQKYDNLLKAKVKCAKAEHTSDLNSDLESKRQRNDYSENDYTQNTKLPSSPSKSML